MSRTIPEHPYQDIYENGHVWRMGYRECAKRYELLRADLRQRFDTMDVFSVLDFGAAEGYFSVRLAEDFPNSAILAVDNNKYLRQVQSHQIAVYPRRMRPADLLELPAFDVGLVFSVLHLRTAWSAMLARLHQKCAVLYVETPEPIGPWSDTCAQVVYDTLDVISSEVLIPRDNPDGLRPMFKV